MSKLRRAGLVLGLCAAISCSGNDRQPPLNPAAPTPTVPPTSTRWSIAGQVVETLTGTPVANPTLSFGTLGMTTGGPDGRFRFEQDTLPSSSTYSVTLTAPGFIARRVQVAWQQGDRTGVTFDVIRNAAPFSLNFYRQLVRNGTETPQDLEAVHRWTSAPSFYVRTVDDEDGRAVESEVIADVTRWIEFAVQAWTGMPVGAIETGAAVRAPARGWVRVTFVPQSDEFCGRAAVGSDPGVIQLSLDGCNCGNQKVAPATIVHEVGHAVGFWHVNDRLSVMFPTISGNCRDVMLSTAERHHAAIAYARPNGNADVDLDPDLPSLAQPFRVMVDD